MQAYLTNSKIENTAVNSFLLLW